jgi:hexosaminidase
MFAPKLGVSFHGISPTVTPDAIAAAANSQIATLEILVSKLGDDREADLAAFKRLFASSPVRPMTIHSTFGSAYDLSSLDCSVRAEAVRAVREGLEMAVTLGTPMVIVHASAEPITASERETRKARTLSALTEIAGDFRATGTRAALELLPRTCLCNTLEELDWFLDRLDPSVFGVCLDVNHAMDRYATLPDMVRALGSRLITTHLSDYDGVDEKHWLPGRGIIEWASLLRALDDIDYQGPFNYECDADGQTPHERVRSFESNFAWLSNLPHRR